MKRWFRMLGVLACLTGLAGPAMAQRTGLVSIDRTGPVPELVRDGQKPWVPKGVIVTALVGPVNLIHGAYARARRRWGPEELAAIRAYGADSIRMHVSQASLDPRNPAYSASYLASVVSAIKEARSAGFTVVISMQWEKPTGVRDQLPMPTGPNVEPPVPSTYRAWQTLAPVFRNDSGVIYELFNEPCLKTDDAGTWAIWQRGHQELIDLVRSLGAKNILIVDGLRCGKFLTNVPALHDPLRRVIYGAHPFPQPARARFQTDMTAGDFARNFGLWQSRGHIVVATAWNLVKRECHDGSDGFPTSAQIAVNTLRFLQAHNIGLFIWAFDLPNTVHVDHDWNRLTDFSDPSCNGGVIGAGRMVHEYYTRGIITAR